MEEHNSSLTTRASVIEKHLTGGLSYNLTSAKIKKQRRDVQTEYGGLIIAEGLKAQGVQVAFTLTGGHVAPVIVGCHKMGIRVVDVRNEATTVFAADAVARITGVPGVAIVTAGPGLTNTITPVKNAQMAQSPLVVLSGATATVLKGRGSLQDIDQLALMKPHVKKMYSPKTVRELGYIIEDAFFYAQEGIPGPVFIELPLDLLYPRHIVGELYGLSATNALGGNKSSGQKKTKGMVDKIQQMYLKYHFSSLFKGFEKIPSPAKREVYLEPADEDSVKKCALWISQSKRPVLVIGSQAVQCGDLGLVEKVREAATSIGMPTFLTSMARGLLGHDNPIQKRHKRAEALKEADLVILASVANDFRLSYGKSIGKAAKIIAINLDEGALYKNRRPHLPILAHPAVTLVQIARQLERIGTNKLKQQWSPWFSKIDQGEANREKEILAQSKVPSHQYLNPVRVCLEIEKHISDQSVIVADGGDFVGTASYIIKPRRPLTWLDPGVFGTLGVGGGFAMGAQVVSPPGTEVWILYGDGALGYSIIEFDTFVRHKIPVIAVVGNDACWMQMYRGQVEIFDDTTACNLDYSAKYHEVVRSLGAEGFIVDSEEALAPTFIKAKQLAKEGKPVLINVLVGKHEFRKGSISL